MSILIKGIDLPNGPIKLVLYPSGKVNEYVLNERIATDYQAIQIPTPHGRLIDWDAFNNKLDIQYAEGRGKALAPTILEAEE